MKKKVLFLCQGNTCRSQMAEAIVNARLGDSWEAYSAGTRPKGYVHPIAQKVLAEIGIQHNGRPKTVDEFKGVPFDLVVTLCDEAAEECPLWLGKGRVVHQGYPDPGLTIGTGEEIQDAFRKVRDDMLKQIPALLET